MDILARIFNHHKWLALGIGALSATGFAPLNLWPVTLICIALLMHLMAIAPDRKAAFMRGWLFGAGHFVVGLNWIATAFTFQAAMPAWLGYLAVVLVSLYLAVYPALATLGAWWITKLAQTRHSGESRSLLQSGDTQQGDSGVRWNDGNVVGEQRANWVLILAFAGMWIITEWLRSWVFTGFSWNPLSASLVSTDFFTHLAPWIGTYGLSSLVILLSGIPIAIFVDRRVNTPVKKRYGPAVLVALSLVGITGTAYFSSVSLMADGYTSTPITVVQPNIGQDDKWEEENVAANFAKLASLTRSNETQPRLIFWPEAAVPDFLEKGYPSSFYYPGSPEESRARLRATMNSGDVMVLGALKLDVNEAGKVYGARNSVFAMDSNSKLIGSYDKSHLVPYGEYLPMRDFLSLFGLSRLAPGDLDFTPGPGPRNIELGRFGTAGIQVCYEIIFSGQVVDPKNRPDFIFNPSNDAWFGAWGPPQHLAQARLRAIEEGLPIIRSTPTGISAVIDAHGRIVVSVPMHQAGRIDTVLPAAHARTLFARYGNILPIGFALLLLLSAVAIGLRRR